MQLLPAKTTPKITSVVHLMLLREIEKSEDSAYGIALSERLSNVMNREISDAQTYVTLKRLEKSGLISGSISQNERPSVVQRGRPRRMYKLTADGKRALAASVEFLKM